MQEAENPRQQLPPQQDTKEVPIHQFFPPYCFKISNRREDKRVVEQMERKKIAVKIQYTIHIFLPVLPYSMKTLSFDHNRVGLVK
jgi:hypothetical protein